MKTKVKDVMERAGKTFLQAFISSFSVESLFIVTDMETIKRLLISMLIASISAGISAVWNLLQNYLVEKIEVEEEEEGRG